MRFLLVFLIPALLLAQAVDPRDREFWNGKFNDPKTEFRRQPSPLLVDAIRGRKPGTAIDLGMGEGRNTIFLAQQGWKTTGVDLADAGVAQARKRAAALGLDIRLVDDSIDHYNLGSRQWDLIAMFYVHAWYHSNKALNIRRLSEALRPGGLLVIEGFAGEKEFMFHTNELLRDFPGLRILRYEDTDNAEAEWAPGEKSHIIRMIAERAP